MSLDSMQIGLSVVLGTAEMSLGRLLRLSRGAIVGLDMVAGDAVEIRANGHPVAHGEVQVHDGAISVCVTRMIRRMDFVTTPGATVGTVSDLAPARQVAAAA